MHLHFQPDAGHAERVHNAPLIVHDIFLRQDVNNFAVQRNGHGLGRVERPLDIARGNFSPLDRNDSVAVEPLDMTARDSRVDRADLASSHQFRFFKRSFDRLDGLLYVDNHALAESRRGTGPNADDIHSAVIIGFADHSAHFGGSYVKTDYQLGFGHTLLLDALRDTDRQFAPTHAIKSDTVSSRGSNKSVP